MAELEHQNVTPCTRIGPPRRQETYAYLRIYGEIHILPGRMEFSDGTVLVDGELVHAGPYAIVGENNSFWGFRDE